MADSEISSTGFTILYEPEHEADTTVDIIFVHGLGGHTQETWAEFDTLSQEFIHWPRDLVPTVCPTARVLAWGYDTIVIEGYFRNSKQTNVSQYGKKLLFELSIERVGCSKRPIIWVAHSLGGIILQQALAMANSLYSDITEEIVRLTAAIMFFGTPQKGSTTPVKAIFKALGLQSDDGMLDSLGYGTSDLEHYRSSFAKVWDRHEFKVKVFYEIVQHNGTFLVPLQSSTFGDPREETRALEGNHFKICRLTERSYSWMSIISKDLRYFHILARAMRGNSGVNVRGTSGQTALHMAAFRGDISSAKMLVSELRADVNIRDDQDRTPLHETARHGFVAIASALVKHGAGVMVKDQKGQTPLHKASQHGHLGMVAFLIEEGADYDSSDNHGVTPLLYAMEKGHESILQLFERARDERDGTAKKEKRPDDGYNNKDDDLYDDLYDNNNDTEKISLTVVPGPSHTDPSRESGSLSNSIIELDENRGSNPESAADEQSSQSGSEEADERALLLELLPSDIAGIVSVLPATDIWISCAQDASMVNKAKTWVETKTQRTWIWWPLTRSKRLLQEGEVRIFWRCACGITEWREVSDVQGELVNTIINLPNTSQNGLPRCFTRARGVGWSTYIGKAVQFLHGPVWNTGSSTGHNYLPPESSSQITSSASSTATPAQASHGSSLGQNSQSNPASALSQSPPTLGTSLQQTAARRTWILLGTQGNKRTVEPAEIPVDEWTTDYHFFRALRLCYRRHRGKLRLWFSIWRLHYCEVVKFHRLALNHMVRDYCDLPTHDDYKYNPKGQEAKNPPISQHMFDVMFNACDVGCNRMLPHDCFQPPGGMDQLERIPKRVRSFQRDMTVEIWGLSTVHDVSFAYVSFYHCLMVLGPLIFYAYWMDTFPQDLQNASVPISLVLGALSMFWSSCGILTSKKMD